LEPIIVSGHDEISVLAESLNKLYERLQENYQELEVKNLTLAEENKRQEVFLRASSHQLKTPITAALLLVQGMINEVGKYKNVKEYLPQVKEQLQSMQKIVEDILYLNHCSRNLNVEKVSLEQIVKECLDSYLVQIAEKGHTVNQDGSMPQLDTDRELIKKIIDNLLSNAINYTPDNGKIHIKYEPNKLKIINEGASIDDEILPHIFEPFVTSNSSNKGHGLGLYVVAYYAQFLGCIVKVTNTEGSVMAELIFA
jgi:signal transduction histidine kinase